MGAVNYGTSDYITMGLRPYDRDDFKSDPGLMEELQKEVDEYGGTLESALDSYINNCYEADYCTIEFELEKHCFHYYHVVLKYGYYEGFYLDIENNYCVYDDCNDRRAANKEITEIKQLLIDCAGLGLVECWPGWVTSYKDYADTIKAINAAVREMREEVRTIPTWGQYTRGKTA